jgi:hypothetical protein
MAEPIKVVDSWDIRHGRVKADRFLEQFPSLLIRIDLRDEDDIIAAARLKSSRRIAYADDFAVALAIRESATLVAGDAE